MIPVHVDVETSRNGTERYDYEVIDDRFMTPLMMNLTLFNLILATERSLGASTLEVRGTIHLKSGEQVEIDNAFAGDTNTSIQATLGTVAPITYLLSGGFEALAIESVELTIRSTDQRGRALVWIGLRSIGVRFVPATRLRSKPRFELRTERSSLNGTRWKYLGDWLRAECNCWSVTVFPSPNPTFVGPRRSLPGT